MSTAHRNDAIENYVNEFLVFLKPKAEKQLHDEQNFDDFIDEDEGDETWEAQYVIKQLDRVDAGELITRTEADNCVRNLAYQHLLGRGESKWTYDLICQGAYKLWCRVDELHVGCACNNKPKRLRRDA